MQKLHSSYLHQQLDQPSRSHGILDVRDLGRVSIRVFCKVFQRGGAFKLTIDKSVENVFSILFYQIVDVAENTTILL